MCWGKGERDICKLLARHVNISLKQVTQLTKNNRVIRKMNTILASLYPLDVNDTLQIVQEAPPVLITASATV